MSERNSLVVLFADISQSTRIYEALGNTEAQALVRRCLNELSALTERYHGRVVKTIGDEVMSVFPSALDAARAASEMQGSLRAVQGEVELPFGPIRIRIGMHFGEVLLEGDEVHGETVIIAARMVKLAKPDQILTTAPTVSALPDELRAMTRYIDEQTLAGRLDKLDLYELLWEVSDLTDLATHAPPAALRTVHRTLRLCFGARECLLDEHASAFTIGRSEQNDLVVPAPLASRRHVIIRYTRGRFVLTDRSVNGTYIARDDGQRIEVLRDDHPLDGSGKISLGEPADKDRALLIDYRCE
jgi:class 3 adenylate cyclase